MSSIKEFNVKIGEDSELFSIGADATNIVFSNEATDPYKNEELENSIPSGMGTKASNIIYGNAYIRNTRRTYVDGVPTISIEEYNDAKGQAQATLAEPVPSDVTPAHDEANAGAFSISYGIGSIAIGHNSSAIGFDCEARGWASHAEGWKSKTGDMSNYSHAEGANTNALHNIAHAEGDATNAEGYGSHSEGRGTWAQGVASHAEGVGAKVLASPVVRENTNAIYQAGENINDVSAELSNENFKSRINGQGSHAEGFETTVKGAFCHGGGILNKIEPVYGSLVYGEQNTMVANNAFMIGSNNQVSNGADNSIVLGKGNTNPGYPNAIFLGHYSDMGANVAYKPALVIGSGTDKDHRSNLITIRHPKEGQASPKNRGEFWANHVDAHFGSLSLIDDWREYEVHFNHPGEIKYAKGTDIIEDAASIWRSQTKRGTMYEWGTYDFTMVFRYSKIFKIIEVWVYPCLNRYESHDKNPGRNWNIDTFPPAGTMVPKLSLFRWNGRGNECFIKDNDLRDLIQTVVYPVQTSFYMHRGGSDYNYQQPSVSALYMNIKALCPPSGASQVISGKELMVYSFPWKDRMPGGSYGGVYHFTYTCW